jgi:hypothetical protein
MQEIFRVGPFLRDAANANDLSDLFEQGAIPHIPRFERDSSSNGNGQ